MYKIKLNKPLNFKEVAHACKIMCRAGFSVEEWTIGLKKVVNILMRPSEKNERKDQRNTEVKR